MNNIIRFTGLSVVVATLFACSGDDVTKVYETTNPTVGLDLVDKGDKMPDCNKDNEGKLIYVADSGMAYFCSNKEWLSFGGENMKGADGEPGEKGDDGEKGDKGDKGAKGAKGDSGTSCSAKKVEDGIEVSCGGKVVGTLSNGEAGESCTAKEVQDGIEVSCGGKVVGTLSNGETGESCTAQVIEGVGVEVSCGGVPVDTLENGANGDCSIESDEAGVVTFSCSNGTFTVNKAQCAGVAYDPAESFCLAGEIVALKGACGGDEIDQTKQFCDTRDGQAYDYVAVDVGGETQVWMAQNLNYDSDELKGESYCSNFVDGSSVECGDYGRVYSWWAAAAADSSADLTKPVLSRYYQGVCPEGWHLPNDYEVQSLFQYYGGKGGVNGVTSDIFRSKTGWDNSPGTSNGTDVLGLNFVPSGTIGDGRAAQVGDFFMMWAGPEVTEKVNNKDNYTKASTIMMFGENPVQYTSSKKSNGAAVRCLMDL